MPTGAGGNNMSPYEVLGVPMNADQGTIRAAYRAMSKRYHPDSSQTANPEKFVEVTRAYEQIKNGFNEPVRTEQTEHVQPRKPAWPPKNAEFDRTWTQHIGSGVRTFAAFPVPLHLTRFVVLLAVATISRCVVWGFVDIFKFRTWFDVSFVAMIGTVSVHFAKHLMWATKNAFPAVPCIYGTSVVVGVASGLFNGISIVLLVALFVTLGALRNR